MKTRYRTPAALLQVAAIAATIAIPLNAPAALSRPAIDPGGVPELAPPDKPRLPAAPDKLNITERTPDSLSISWMDRSATEDGSELQRRESSGTSWTVLRQWGPIDGTESHTDSGLIADTRYCYRLRVSNGNGESFSPHRCAYTRDGRNNKLWRLQVVLQTAGIDDAGTDDAVRVQLNPQSGNQTWLDYARNDFEKDDTFAYDLNLSGIGEMGDISQISISKTGSDGWCIADLTLKANGLEIYSEDFSNEPSGCKWLDNENGHQRSYIVPHGQLREHASWINYNSDGAGLLLLASGIPAEEMVSRIEAIAGDSFHGQKAYWGHLHGPGVEASRGCPIGEASCQRIHFDLDVAADAPLLPDPEVDVDFDLDISCSGGEFSFRTENIKVGADSSWFWEVLSVKLIELLDDYVERKARESFAAIDKSFDVDICPSIEVDEWANVTFKLAARTTPGDNTDRPAAPTPGPLAPTAVQASSPAKGTFRLMRR